MDRGDGDGLGFRVHLHVSHATASLSIPLGFWTLVILLTVLEICTNFVIASGPASFET